MMRYMPVLWLSREMDSILIRDAPVVPLFYDEVFRFVRHNITGLEPNGLNMLDLRYVRKK
jgi:peptide/nickel transport system substrate-binding protein